MASVTQRGARFQLFLASSLMLFVELVLIRWSGAYVIYLSYFSNFVLLGSFLGIGIGFLRARKGPDLFRWAPAVLAIYLGLIKGLPVVIDRSGSDLIYFGALTTKGLPAWLMLPAIFIAVTAVMACIAHGVATRFLRFEALEAYRLDIAGSLVGIVAFSVLALAGVPPIGWGVVIALAFLPLLTEWRTVDWAAFAVILVVTVMATYQGGTIWSPYYRIEHDERAIRVNGIPHQAMTPTAGTPYEIPYARMTTPPGNVLVIGAGNGNDVDAALAAGATHVDAVEIDHELQEIGAAFHPSRPYDDPRVNVVIDDGRAFLERTERRYDLVVFALPDSLTLVSGQSTVRLESYLFTQEAIEAAHRHLAADGVLAMYNFYRERWLLDRLAGTLQSVFGRSPCLDLGPTSGGGVGRFAMMVVGSTPSATRCEATWTPAAVVVEPATDDRPFVYLRDRTIPSRYVVALGLVLLASAIVVRLSGGRLAGMRGHLDLFLMGAAFLMIETKSVVQFALLFGTTWFVNSLVFAGILLTVLLAIEVERRVRIGRPVLLFGLLFGALLLAGVVPPERLLAMSVVPRFLAATALAFLPVFIANLIFAERFRDTEDTTSAFGANLLGAMVGGTLEYVSLVTGYRALLLVAAVLYVAAWITGPARPAPFLGGDRVKSERDLQPAASAHDR
jgi:hypothetical protein